MDEAATAGRVRDSLDERCATGRFDERRVLGRSEKRHVAGRSGGRRVSGGSGERRALDRRGERGVAGAAADGCTPDRFDESGVAGRGDVRRVPGLSGERRMHERFPVRRVAGRSGGFGGLRALDRRGGYRMRERAGRSRIQRAMRTRKPVRIVVPVLLACAALVAALSGCSTGSDAVAQGGTFQFVSPGGKTDIFYNPPAKRGTIGTLSGPNLLTNKTISVNDFPNQVVVLNVWGQWCGPCRAEAPELEKVYEQSKARGVAFLGINVRDPEQDKAQDFVTTNHIQYPSIYDPEFRSLLALGGKFPTSVIPTTLVLDRKHRVAAVFLRSLLAGDLQPVVDRIAAESAQ